MIHRWNTGKLVHATAALTIPGRDPDALAPTAINVIAHVEEPNEGADVRIRLWADFLQAKEEDIAAEAFGSWLVQVAGRVNAAWGFVTADAIHPAQDTPYDKWFFINEGASKALEHPRGYY